MWKSEHPKISASGNQQMEQQIIQAVLEQSPVGNYIYQNDQFLYVNPAFIEMFGYSIEEVYESNFLQRIVDPTYWPILERVKHKLLLGKSIKSGYRIPMLKKDGTRIHVDIHPKPTTLSGEAAIIGTVLDVTEQVQLEKALRKSHDILRYSHKIAGIGSWSYDYSTHQMVWSHELYELLRLDPFLPLSLETFEEMIHPDDRLVLQKTVEEAEQQKPFDVEFRLILPNGDVRNFHAVASIIADEDGHPSQMIGVLQDVTRQKSVERQLRDSQQRYASLFNNSPNLVCSLDLDGRILQVNPAFVEKMGYSQEEVIGTHFSQYIDPSDYQKNKYIFKQVLQGKMIHYEAAGITKSGNKLQFAFSTLPVLVDQEMVGMFGMCRDISGEKEAIRLLEESEQRYRSLFDHNMDGVIAMDLQGRIQNLNPMAKRITGYTDDEIIGQTFYPLVISDDIGKVLDVFQKVKQGDPHRLEIGILHKKGNMVDLDVNMLPIILGDRIEGVFFILRDITEQKRTQQIIETMAYQDPLTKLPNRRLFMERLELRLTQNRNNEDLLAVLFIDLDRLKTVNDSLGHAVGDLLIQHVAERLSKCIRDEDVLARLGGDEFAILLPDLKDPSVATKVAKRILQSFKQPFLLNGQEFFTSASIGIAYAPEHGNDVETLIRNADTAMYEVKYNGKDDYRVYQPDVGYHQKKRFELETALYEALQRDEFVLYYQPRIETKTGKPTGVEALLRWNHPKLGIIPPSEFIPIAEESGLIIPIGEWVLKQACSQIKQWQREGLPPFRVSVNVSARQFQRSNILETVQAVLAERELSPHWLEIEITEGTLMQNEWSTISTIQALIDIGVHISIDDFGTGYSSMSYLKQFKIQTLKIDRSFISGVPNNSDNAAISKALINLAHSLNMNVVAEGVENGEELTFFIQNHTDEIQGYHISRPVPAHEIRQVLESLSTRLAKQVMD
jgi:diguanylate cyclase (GGDEF)-like protein/PAS domain S-box-containing protein